MARKIRFLKHAAKNVSRIWDQECISEYSFRCIFLLPPGCMDLNVTVIKLFDVFLIFWMSQVFQAWFNASSGFRKLALNVFFLPSLTPLSILLPLLCPLCVEEQYWKHLVQCYWHGWSCKLWQRNHEQESVVFFFFFGQKQTSWFH